MIITVQGSSKGNNKSEELLAALSFFGIAREKKSTLVLQFVNKTDECVENCLIGENLRNESLTDDQSVPDISSGTDTLFANSTGFSKDVFITTTKQLVDGAPDNTYDITICSRSMTFERELCDREKRSEKDSDMSMLEELLTSAQKIYKLVYILLPSKNEYLCNIVTKLSDVNIYCIKQGLGEPLNISTAQNSENTPAMSKTRNYYVVTDYFYGSKYSVDVLKKIYNINMLFGLIHNVAFEDACRSGNLLSFVNDNISYRKKDSIYETLHNIEILYNTIVKNKEKKISENAPDDEIKQYDEPVFLKPVWTPITENAVVEITKTGLFKNKKVEEFKLEPSENDDIPAENNERDFVVPDLQEAVISQIATEDEESETENKESESFGEQPDETDNGWEKMAQDAEEENKDSDIDIQDINDEEKPEQEEKPKKKHGFFHKK